MYKNFGLILSICSQDIEQKPNFDVIKGRNSVANFVDDNVFTKFGLNHSIRFQDIE